ncbi:MAG: hypothetical protein V9E98_03240 [Candidatus Nanopelagicales bacterium]
MEPASADDVRQWISHGVGKRGATVHGWAVLSSSVTRTVTIDAESAGMDFPQISGVFDRLPESCQQRSRNGGRHAYLRITAGDLPADTVLARRAVDGTDTLLAELRRHRQYAVIHGPGRPRLPDDWQVHELTRDEYEVLVAPIRELHEPSDAERRRQNRQDRPPEGSGLTGSGAVITDAVADGSLPVPCVLPDAWEVVGTRPDGAVVFVRPGAESDQSGNCLRGVVVIHSSSVDWAEPGVPMTAAWCLAQSRYDGDFQKMCTAIEAAAAAMVDDGEVPESPFDTWPQEVLEQVHTARAQAQAEWRSGRVRRIDEWKGSTGDGESPGGPNPAGALDSVWNERGWLEHLRAAAYARGVSAPAVLAAFLARYCAEIDPRHVLPPIVGGHVSLNLYVALLGRSGAGKSSTLAVAEDLATWGTLNPGVASGEGLLRQYGAYDKGVKKWVQRDTAMAVQVDEVASLTPQTERGGSTLLGLLNSAWMGSKLSQPYADPTKRAEMAAHGYRLSVVVGVQVGKADGLLQHADAGTPQRFLWAPLVDPSIPRRRDRPEWPGPLELPRPPLGGGRHLTAITVPDDIADHIDDARHAVATSWAPLGSNGDGQHDNLQRLKVSALLALMDGRHDITGDDWAISGHLQAMSAVALKYAHADRQARAKADDEHRGLRQARQAAVAQRISDDTGPQRLAQRIARHVHTHHRDRPDGCVRKCAKGRASQDGLLAFWDEALAIARRAGWIVVDERPHPTKPTETVARMTPGRVKP